MQPVPSLWRCSLEPGQAQVHSPRPTKGASFGLWQRKIIELKSAKRYRCYRWCVSSKRRVEHRTCKYICWWSCFNNFAQMSYNHRPLVANNIKFPTWRSYDSAFRNGGYPPIHLSCQGFQNPFPKKTSNSHNLQNILHPHEHMYSKVVYKLPYINQPVIIHISLYLNLYHNYAKIQSM